MDTRPIGIFDSGLGGLTVCSAFRRHLPAENLVYFGDTARVPYGPKSSDTIIRYSVEIARFLEKRDVKMIVVACNTASTHSLETLQQNFDLPVVGVVRPGVAAAAGSGFDDIAIIATRGTVNSGLYQRLIIELKPDARLQAVAASMLVALVEEGWCGTRVAETILHEYLDGVVSAGAQALILGCTHFPLLKDDISRLYPGLKLIDSSYEVAMAARKVLEENSLSAGTESTGGIDLYVSDRTQAFAEQVKNFFGADIEPVEVVQLEH